MVKKGCFFSGLMLSAVTVLGGFLLARMTSEKGHGDTVESDKLVAVFRSELDRFLLSAPTNGLWEVSDPEWSNRLTKVNCNVQNVRSAFLAVHNQETSASLLREAACRILDGVVARTNGWEELDFYKSSCLMLDNLAAASWETIQREEVVLALWALRQRKYREAHERCVKENQDLKAEYRRFYPKLCELNLRMAKVKSSELTKDEIAFGKWWHERLEFWDKRRQVLSHLLRMYPNWDVEECGRKLDGGRLYERFKSLKPEELQKIEARVRSKSNEKN